MFTNFPKCAPRDTDKQIQNMFMTNCLIFFGACMNISLIIKVEILMFFLVVTQVPPLMLIIEPRTLSIFGMRIDIFLDHVSFWCSIFRSTLDHMGIQS